MQFNLCGSSKAVYLTNAELFTCLGLHCSRLETVHFIPFDIPFVFHLFILLVDSFKLMLKGAGKRQTFLVLTNVFMRRLPLPHPAVKYIYHVELRDV